MHVFIAGCARSGTDLLRDLFHCFHNTVVLPGEHGLAKFDELGTSTDLIVIKRTKNAYLEIPTLPPSIRLIYCIRHPYDCLTSSHPHTISLRQFHVTPIRWLAEYRAITALIESEPDRKIIIIRYEDLVTHPDDIQHRIERELGLTSKHPFSENPHNISFFTTSVEKWRKNGELFTYFDSFDVEMRVMIEQFCGKFLYKLPIRG